MSIAANRRTRGQPLIQDKLDGVEGQRLKVERLKAEG
jgi:hypothetical protein